VSRIPPELSEWARARADAGCRSCCGTGIVVGDVGDDLVKWAYCGCTAAVRAKAPGEPAKELA